jgi:hypothetical protein
MNKFIGYVALSSSSKICCKAKGSKEFTTLYSHFVRLREKFPRAIFLSLRMYNPWIERNGCFIVWNVNSPSSAAICLHSSVIVSLVK